jgi:hypothetical protein
VRKFNQIPHPLFQIISTAMEDYTICSQVCLLDHFLEQKLYFAMLASNSDEARLCSGDGFSVSLPAHLLLASSKLTRDTFTPGQAVQDVFLPSVKGSTMLLLVEILRSGKTGSLGTMDNLGCMLKEVQEAMELLEIPGCTSLMRVNSKSSKFSEQAEAKRVKIIAPSSTIHLAMEELPRSIIPVVEVTQMSITPDSLKENPIIMSKDCTKIKVKSEPAEEDLSQLDDELYEQVKENVLPRDCHICKKQFMKRKNLFEHFRRVHREVMFSCEHCDLKFVSEFILKTHIKSHQVKENVLPSDCHICKKQFMKRTNMLEHFRRVHKEVLFSCEHCDMKFVSEFILKKHIKSHQGNRINCDYCVSTFRIKEQWCKHMRKSHRGEMFSCQDCDKKFVQEANLKAHVKSRHVGIPFHCSECPATFSKKTSMQMHMRFVHSGVVVCEQCRSTFSHNGSLRRHMRNVHQKLLELTDECGEQFDVNENKNMQECPNKERVVQ